MARLRQIQKLKVTAKAFNPSRLRMLSSTFFMLGEGCYITAEDFYQVWKLTEFGYVPVNHNTVYDDVERVMYQMHDNCCITIGKKVYAMATDEFKDFFDIIESGKIEDDVITD